MIKFSGKSVTLNKSCELTPRQLHKLKSLETSEQSEYLLSLLGYKRRVSVNGKVSGDVDPLARKSKNSVLRRFRQLLDNGSDAEHKPLIRTKTSQWVGVEIECLFERRDEDEDCDYCGGSGNAHCYNCDGEGRITLEDSNGNEYRVRCAECDGEGSRECSECDGGSSDNSSLQNKIRDALTRAKITNCSVRSDGSLSGSGMTGVEVTVLFDASHGFSKIQRVCKILNDMGASVNTTCGLHVHLDMHGKTRSESHAIGHTKLGRCLPVLAKLVPESRRANTYCKLEVSESGSDDCRYYAVNMTALSKHDTIEVRLHSGTTDPLKIESWVRLLLAIVNTPKTFSSPVKSLARLARLTGIDDSLLEYFSKRLLKFNGVDANDNEESGVELVSQTEQNSQTEQLGA